MGNGKYGVRVEWWKHLRWTKSEHWKKVRKLWKKRIREGNDE